MEQTRRDKLLSRLADILPKDGLQMALEKALKANGRIIYYCPRRLRLVDGTVMECPCCGKGLESIQPHE